VAGTARAPVCTLTVTVSSLRGLSSGLSNVTHGSVKIWNSEPFSRISSSGPGVCDSGSSPTVRALPEAARVTTLRLLET
jgi:hypothetical protein